MSLGSLVYNRFDFCSTISDEVVKYVLPRATVTYGETI